MPHASLLPWMLLAPLVGALLVMLLVPRGRSKWPGIVALLVSLVPLVLVAVVIQRFSYPVVGVAVTQDGLWQEKLELQWIPQLGIQFLLGIDSISLWMLALTAVLTPVAILSSFNAIQDRQPEYYAWLLVLSAGMMGVFAARDALLFYLFFEFTLIPIFLLIGIWGGHDRRKAAAKYFLYTFAGSIVMLASIVFIAWKHYVGIPGIAATGMWDFQFDQLYAVAHEMTRRQQILVFLGLMAGLAIKTPLFPLHSWLPLAYAEGPVAVVMVGMLLKLGLYGMLRLVIPMVPEAIYVLAPVVAIFCVMAILYGSLVAWAQRDMKKVLAYSSLAHLGYAVLGMFALTAASLSGSILYMLNYAISTAALFLVVGMIEERYKTRDMTELGGLARRLPALAFFAVFFTLSSIAMPGLNGFVSEFLVLIGTFTGKFTGPTGIPSPGLGITFSVLAAVGVILSAVYMLYMVGRVIYGPLKEPPEDRLEPELLDGPADAPAPEARDLSGREWLVLVPMAAMVLVLGVYPMFVLDSLRPSVALLEKSQRSDQPYRITKSADRVAPGATLLAEVRPHVAASH